jgi:hypothetical protein
MPADGQTPRQAPGLRIGVDLRSLVGSVTGIGRYTSALLAALMPAPGFRYVGLAHRQPGEAGSALLDAGLAMEVQPAPLGVLWQQLRLPRRLQRGDLDLFWSPLLTLPRHPPIPSVVTVHDLTPVLYPETQRWKLRLSVLPFLERTLESANTIVTGSHAITASQKPSNPENQTPSTRRDGGWAFRKATSCTLDPSSRARI